VSEKTNEYQAILKEAFETRVAGNEAREEELLSKLDKLWFSMNAGEVKETELISAEFGL
jgi:hypothetical protein